MTAMEKILEDLCQLFYFYESICENHCHFWIALCIKYRFIKNGLFYDISYHFAI